MRCSIVAVVDSLENQLVYIGLFSDGINIPYQGALC